MSAIGPGGFLPITFAGNQAVNQTQQREHQQTKDAVTAKTFEAELRQKTERATEDVDDPQLSSDRDADGRLLGGDADTPRQSNGGDAEENERPRSRVSIDPEGEIGMQLDLEA